MIAIAISYENGCSCSARIPDDTLETGKALLKAICKELHLLEMGWDEVLTVKNDCVTSYCIYDCYCDDSCDCEDECECEDWI
jgi:hypothetical protein